MCQHHHRSFAQRRRYIAGSVPSPVVVGAVERRRHVEALHEQEQQLARRRKGAEGEQERGGVLGIRPRGVGKPLHQLGQRASAQSVLLLCLVDVLRSESRSCGLCIDT